MSRIHGTTLGSTLELPSSEAHVSDVCLIFLFPAIKIHGRPCSQTCPLRRIQAEIYHKQESPLCTDSKSCRSFKLKHPPPVLFPVPSIILTDKYSKDGLVVRHRGPLNIKRNFLEGFHISEKSKSGKSTKASKPSLSPPSCLQQGENSITFGSTSR